MPNSINCYGNTNAPTFLNDIQNNLIELPQQRHKCKQKKVKKYIRFILIFLPNFLIRFKTQKIKYKNNFSINFVT